MGRKEQIQGRTRIQSADCDAGVGCGRVVVGASGSPAGSRGHCSCPKANEASASSLYGHKQTRAPHRSRGKLRVYWEMETRPARELPSAPEQVF